MKRVPLIAVLFALLLAFAAGESLAIRPSQDVSSPETIGLGGKLGDDDAPDKTGRELSARGSASAIAVTRDRFQEAPSISRNVSSHLARVKLLLLKLTQSAARAAPRIPD